MVQAIPVSDLTLRQVKEEFGLVQVDGTAIAAWQAPFAAPVDFRGLGGIAFIGKPKQPTFTVCQLNNSEYRQQQYRRGEAIASALFPDLHLRLDDLMP